MIYKLIEKIIEKRLKPMLRKNIPEEKIEFLFKRKIHDAFSLVQEALHSIKIKKNPFHRFETLSFKIL